MSGKSLHPIAGKNGFTTRQMKAAAVGALFVWYTDNIGYPFDLSLWLDRRDITVVGMTWIGNEQKVRCMPRGKQIVLDHRVKIDFRMRAVMYALSHKFDVMQFEDL